MVKSESREEVARGQPSGSHIGSICFLALYIWEYHGIGGDQGSRLGVRVGFRSTGEGEAYSWLDRVGMERHLRSDRGWVVSPFAFSTICVSNTRLSCAASGAMWHWE